MKSLRMLSSSFLFWCLRLHGHVAAAPPFTGTRSCEIQERSSSVAILHVDSETSRAFLWTSIALAVVTAFLQGLVTSLASMTETSNSWTFRFRLATAEHLWWSTVSILLCTSLVFSVLSFASGNDGETVSILVLTTTTLLAVVRYTLPAWRSRAYIHNRFLAWTGLSRTAINANMRHFCASNDDWARLAHAAERAGAKGVPTDAYGWHLTPVPGIKLDPTDILNCGVVNCQMGHDIIGVPRNIYADGYDQDANISLVWGGQTGFRIRVSRSISAVPLNLLKSQPFTIDGFAGEGLCLAMGVLGRNKGLHPRDIVFNMNSSISADLELNSTWSPRPAKTLRSYYRSVLQGIYGGLGDSFVAAAVELSLVFMDANPHAVRAWLRAGCDQQDMRVNMALVESGATSSQLRAHYQSSYVCMLLSINNMGDGQIGQENHGFSSTARPEITCTGLLLKARGEPMPAWWTNERFNSYRETERRHLSYRWGKSAAQLLGLNEYPGAFDNNSWDD